MAIPGMDLQSQYDQTLQNTIGKSRLAKLQDVRKQQTLANTDWSQRGVGQGAQRMAGFQEVNPSSMPNMSDETRSFIKPLLGTYQEGGRNVEGFYGKENPYTQSGLEDIITKQGYARAPASLEEQFQYAGLKLPNAYGQNYYNASHESTGNEIGKYREQERLYNEQKRLYDEQVKQQQAQPRNQYEAAGFIPGKDNGEWLWADSRDEMIKALYGRQLPGVDVGYGGGSDQAGTGGGGSWESILGWNTGGDQKLADGGGRWINPNVPNYNLGYTKTDGYKDIKAEMKNMALGRIVKPIVFAGMSLANPAFGAMASTLSSGLNGGDWGKALLQGAASYAGGELAGAYGGDLASSLGGTSDLAKSIASGAIRTGVNTLGGALAGNGLDWQGGLANLASGVAGGSVGDFVGNSIGGDIGKIVGGASRSFTSSALSNYLKGDKPGINTAINTLSGAAGGLSSLFANTNEDKQQVNGKTQLANTLQGTKYGSTKTRGT